MSGDDCFGGVLDVAAVGLFTAAVSSRWASMLNHMTRSSTVHSFFCRAQNLFFCGVRVPWQRRSAAASKTLARSTFPEPIEVHQGRLRLWGVAGVVVAARGVVLTHCTRTQWAIINASVPLPAPVYRAPFSRCI